jgi:hypothetical protein
MITLAAYGIRKAYKKQQARKAQKEQLERESGDPATVSHFDDLRPTSSTSSYRQSPHQQRHPVDRGLVNYSSTTPSELTRVESPSPSSRTAYSGSVYSQKSYTDPMEEMRQYQAYVQRQSYDFAIEPDPPAYECVVGQDAERPPWKSPFSMAATRTENLSQIRESRHIPQGPDRLVELDSSSESSPSRSHEVSLRLFHPRSPVHQTGSPHTQLLLDDELQASLDELVVEYPPPLTIRKSKEVERFELHPDEAQPQPLEAERPQLKRPRSESESEIESEDNEEVIVRFNVADRTKRPYSKRGSLAS